MSPTATDDDDDDRHLPESLWHQLFTDPTHAPIHLATAAVDRWGQQARDDAVRIRREHPGATSQELALLVKKRFARLARSEGAAAGVPGSLAPLAGTAAALLPDLVALAWIQTRMVVHIAAVYGHDTTDQDMAAEVLMLQGIYNTTEAA